MICWIIAGIVIIILIVSIVWWLQYYLLFFPEYDIKWTPNIIYDDVMIGNKIHAWYFSSFENQPTILFCHGTNGNIGDRQYIIDICQGQKVNLIVFDYSGYGNSPGYPTQDTICEDGISVYNYLRGRGVDSDSIIIWGESLGGAVAAYIASKNNCSKLILMSTFSSLDDVVAYKNTNKMVLGLVYMLSLHINMLPTKNIINLVKCPIVIVHSEEDDYIPVQNAEILYNNIPHACKKLVKIRGGHASPKFTEENLSDLFSFCAFDTYNCSYCLPILDNLSFSLRS